MDQVWWPLVSTVHGDIASFGGILRTRSVKSRFGGYVSDSVSVWAVRLR